MDISKKQKKILLGVILFVGILALMEIPIFYSDKECNAEKYKGSATIDFVKIMKLPNFKEYEQKTYEAVMSELTTPKHRDQFSKKWSSNIKFRGDVIVALQQEMLMDAHDCSNSRDHYKDIVRKLNAIE